jgi:type II secretory pathway component PulK
MSASQRGVALVVALFLLVILTVLATTGMKVSIAELVMAGNEQFRQKASAAASAGVEVTIWRILSGASGRSAGTERIGPIETGEPRIDTYTVSLRYTGREAPLPGASAEKFAGNHFEIESTGESARNARDVQVQGLMLVTPTAGVQTFQRIGAGLDSAAAP